ncbi:hypothetical protein [Micromonospora sp. NPDC051296]|uniref:hypothetical protein n=1 Tax=Micromonospora sp. NPDC051296 TaxID=3155046 RepID=UPI003423A3EF
MSSPTKAGAALALPVAPAPPCNDTPEVVSGQAGVLDGGRWVGRFNRAAALTVPRTPALSVEAAPVSEPPPPAPAEHPPGPAPQPPPPQAAASAAPSQPRWIDTTRWGADDRAQLRRALSERYDAYARVVTRTLAEEPGLRAAGGGADLVGDLVALCAYGADRDAVNQVLRGADGRSETQSLIARGAVSGLRRLPTVIGPVYATSATSVVASYRAGDELVEPAFVDVHLTGGGRAVAVEYVIWSVSARRVDQFMPAAQPVATFPPGSRFAVLAVDEPAGDQPMRVLLRDRTGQRPGDGTWREETLRRLRQHGQATVADQPSSLDFALGLDPQGHPFPAPTPATSGGPRP